MENLGRSGWDEDTRPMENLRCWVATSPMEHPENPGWGDTSPMENLRRSGWGGGTPHGEPEEIRVGCGHQAHGEPQEIRGG